MPPPGDSTAADFLAGSGDSGVHLLPREHEVILRPAIAGHFDGEGPPPGWSVEASVPGGQATFTDGGVALDGAGVFAADLVGNGRSVEVAATFARRANQHVGLAVDFVSAQWISFGTKYGNALYARTNFYLTEDERLPGDFLGSRHRFRIDWNVLDIDFSVDGGRQAHLMVPVPAFMRPGAACTTVGGDLLLVEWILVTPYAPGGVFVSRVLGSGAVVSWDRCRYEATVPAGTHLALAVRSGPTPTPGGGWTAWQEVSDDGPIGLHAAYAQYRATLSTTNPRLTPALRSVVFDTSP